MPGSYGLSDVQGEVGGGPPQGAQQEAQLVEGVGGRDLQRGEVLAGGFGVGGVRGGALGPQGGLGHGVGDEVVHLPGDLQTQFLQAFLRATGFVQAGLFACSYRRTSRDEKEPHNGLEHQPGEVVVGHDAGGVSL